MGQVGTASGGSNGGGTGVDSTPLCAEADPTQVIAPQRITLLTAPELINMIRLVNDTEAQQVVTDMVFPIIDDTVVRFPPVITETYHAIPDADTLTSFVNLATHVGNYVTANFAAVTKCASPGTDACAISYLNALAARAYRRDLTTDEQNRLTGPNGLYYTVKSQMVNGYQVTMSVEEATGFAVNGLFMSPQLTWRWELGGTTSTSPAGVYLTDAELATNLAFFLTDRPPDDMVIADAKAGTLRQNIAQHVDRILATQPARDWMTHLMQIFFFLNQLPTTNISTDREPLAGGALYADLAQENLLFMNDALWNGKVTDLVTSQKAFLNTGLATEIYKVDAPAGASPTNFVATMLDPTQRAGLLTSAAWITTRARSTGVGIVPRGLGVKAKFTCLQTDGPPPSISGDNGPVAMQRSMLDMLTAQQQVDFRKTTAPCNSCHPSFDPYGLVLDWYDVVGRYRQTDDLGMPVDGTTTLPATLGGDTVTTAVELSKVLSHSDVFTNCMAQTVLQYAIQNVAVELPLPAVQQKGCAAAGIAHKLRTSSKQSFTDLARAVATSPAFAVRQVMQ